jgi:L-aspartate oxidase
MDESFDLIVIGSGIAGLFAALRASVRRPDGASHPGLRVLLVTKGALEESNTRYAQGGIAAALGPEDSPELHLRDTIAAGDGLCDAESVAVLTREAPDCIVDLLQRGVPFDRDGDELAWTLEAAHSLPRVLHAGGDATGAGIERTLASAVRAAGVEIWEHALCTDLRLAAGGSIRGVDLLLRDDSIVTILAPYVIVATGGAGQLYSRTTNPEVATGDGIAAAYRAGAELMDLEFVQFHPTALALEGAPSFLISEAVRGEGGILNDDSGRAFMTDFHPDRELAPRDVVARAIHQQMALTESDHVWLDLRNLPPERVERRFPSIVRFCRKHGVDPVRDRIPVAPAAHYLMGGIRTDVWGRTTIPGLFACGEAACTGVHGANRLASNSLLEGLVFARRAVMRILDDVARDSVPASHRSATLRPISDPVVGDVEMAPPPTGVGTRPRGNGVPRCGAKERRLLGQIMWEDAGLVRSAESLARAADRIEQAAGSPDAAALSLPARYESSNLGQLARLVVASAAFRGESRGGHFRTDFPRREAAWRRHTVISQEGIGLAAPRTGSTDPHAVSAHG